MTECLPIGAQKRGFKVRWMTWRAISARPYFMTQARRAAEQERKYALSKKAAAAAKSEMMAAVERRTTKQTATAATAAVAAVKQTKQAKGGDAVRASFPGASPAKQKPSVTDEKLTFAPPPPVPAPPLPVPPGGVPGAPRTLSEAGLSE